MSRDECMSGEKFKLKVSIISGEKQKDSRFEETTTERQYVFNMSI